MVVPPWVYEWHFSWYSPIHIKNGIRIWLVKLYIKSVYTWIMEYKCDRCSSIFTEFYRLEIHRQVHDRKSKIKEYGSAEFNEYRLWDYKQGG